jgi:hypothetical protein
MVNIVLDRAHQSLYLGGRGGLIENSYRLEFILSRFFTVMIFSKVHVDEAVI